MPRKPSQQARLALQCNPGEGTQANKTAINPQGRSNEGSKPQAHRASCDATRVGTKCRMSLSDESLNPAPGGEIKQGGHHLAWTSGV